MLTVNGQMSTSLPASLPQMREQTLLPLHLPPISAKGWSSYGRTS